jgi:hypothetical protein
MAELVSTTIMSDTDHLPPAAPDPGLRRLLKWVFAALVLTVLVAILIVELTLRYVNLR